MNYKNDQIIYDEMDGLGEIRNTNTNFWSENVKGSK
jgi:hypothetical protein